MYDVLDMFNPASVPKAMFFYVRNAICSSHRVAGELIQ